MEVAFCNLPECLIISLVGLGATVGGTAVQGTPVKFQVLYKWEHDLMKPPFHVYGFHSML